MRQEHPLRARRPHGRRLTTTNGKGQTLQDLALVYDNVDNPKTINDGATYPWPAGSLAPSRALGYDDLYRLTSVTTTYGANGSDSFASPPYAPEVGSSNLSFPYLETPPLVPDRVESQSFGYDAIDNMTSSDDDMHVAPDRSFGSATYGVALAPGQGQGQPNRFETSTASNGTKIGATV